MITGTTIMTITTGITTTMPTDAALHRLLAWTSPSYPIGAFSYSHGLETAVSTGAVVGPDALAAYVEAVLERGGGWTQAVLYVHAWRAAGDAAAFDEIAELAAAFVATAETALESHQQGRAFLQVTREAWPHKALDGFAARMAGRPVAHVAVFALAAAAHGVPLSAGLHAMLHGLAANLVSAGVRLVPLGQTDGQRVTARLARIIPGIVDRALSASLDACGSSAPRLDLASIHHETLYTRLFRS